LWGLRRSPLAFGAVLAVGFLHREFTIFAVPALLIVEAAAGEKLTGDSLRRAARAGVGFCAVWLAVDAIKIYQAGGSLGLQAASLAGQMCLAPSELAPRALTVFTQALPALYGGTLTPLMNFRMNTPVAAGSPAVGWMLAIVFSVMAARLAWSYYQQPKLSTGEAPFVYLGLVGVFTAAAYPLSCNITPGNPPLLRYILLALFVPVGCFGAFMWRERSPALRALVPAAFALWGAANLAGNVGLLRASIKEPPVSEHRIIADYLVSQRILYARAIYWDAYAIDFLSREKVIVSSVDLVRIPDYKRRVDENSAYAYNLPRVPCRGGPQVASWCVQPP
jgi:hypothetical protein